MGELSRMFLRKPIIEFRKEIAHHGISTLSVMSSMRGSVLLTFTKLALNTKHYNLKTSSPGHNANQPLGIGTYLDYVRVHVPTLITEELTQ